MENKRSTGGRYEQMAGNYLEKKGYQILEYNYRCRFGEIDIIAKDGSYLVFCEVKYRSSLYKGDPLEAVDRKKQQVLSKCALYYVTKQGLFDDSCRFDVVGISGKSGDESIKLVQNAFDYIG